MSKLAQAEKQVDNPYIAAEMDSAYVEFLRTHPQYETTGLLDEWRKTEYGRLDENKQIYLDYTGGGLYGVSQLRQHTWKKHAATFYSTSTRTRKNTPQFLPQTRVEP